MNTPLKPTPDAHPIRIFMAVAISEAIREKLTGIQVRLMKSELTAQGPIYTMLHESRLSAKHDFVPTLKTS